MYQYTEVQNVLLDTTTGQTIPFGHRLWPTEWLKTNTPSPIPALSLAERNEAIRQGVYKWLDSVVQANGYDNIVSCVSYAASKVAKHKKEGQAALDWRDAVNSKLVELVTSPPVGVSTLEQVIALLPAPELFGWIRDPIKPGAGPKDEIPGKAIS